ncbi:MAG: hypothetical protein QM528_08760 [Phycisphaerales bacterium]|nr:hypothetical protein [Phycisphaerales bacterium]
MKMNEVAGIGNWNTAEFWEYNTRTGVRANRDSVVNPSESPYATNHNNPIANSDPNGDYSKGAAFALSLLHGAHGITQDKKTGEWGYRYSLSDKPGARGIDYGVPQKKPDGNRAATANSKPKSVAVANSGGGLSTANEGLGGTQGGGGVNWNGVNTGLQVADGFGVAAAAGREIALNYRMSQPLMNRVGMSTNLKAISGLGTASKYLGAAGSGAAALGTVLDYRQMQNGQMSGARFGYNTLGTAVGIGVSIGVGAVPGAAAGGAFYIGQQMYDGYNWWAGQMSIYLTNFENRLKSGWVPGR